MRTKVTDADAARAHRPTRLAIVDDHRLSRDGLQDMLAEEPSLHVVWEATDGLEAVELCRRTRPDAVLMDLRMPRMDGLTATRAIKQEHPETCVLVLTIHEKPDFLLEALRAGAAGYILKDAHVDDVVSAIRRATSGESPLPPKLSTQLLRQLALEAGETLSKPGRAKLPYPLTPREVEVLELLALGKTNREIAQDFMITVGTVKNHVEHLTRKLEVSDRTQAVVRALELGVISLPTGRDLRLLPAAPTGSTVGT